MDLSLQFKCRACAMFFRDHHPTCPYCLAQGQLLPVPHRSRAEIDSQPGVASARDIARMTWAEVKQYACPGLVLGLGALVNMEGAPGAGKSTLACRLADSVEGAALLVSTEEAIGPSLAGRLDRCAIKKPTFTVVTNASVDIVVDVHSLDKRHFLFTESHLQNVR
jgi:predicted ATP-dependent serine protease